MMAKYFVAFVSSNCKRLKTLIMIDSPSWHIELPTLDNVIELVPSLQRSIML